jgi:hypothetical protein
VYHYHLGLSYFQTNNPEGTKVALTEAIRLNPAFPGVQDARNILKKL